MATTTWSAYTDRGNLAGTMLDSLADATLSAASTELDNATNKDTHALIEVNLGSITPVSPAYLEIYMIKAPDGTNYEQTPVVAGADVNSVAQVIPVVASASAKRVMSKFMIALPPCKVKFYVGNQLGVAMAATGNTFDVYTANLESA